MAKSIGQLRSTSKTNTNTRQYLLVSDIGTNESTKIALNDVFPALQSGKETGGVSAGSAGTTVQDLFVGGGVGSTASNTNKSTLIFKGIKPEVNTSGSESGALEIRTDTSTADPNKRNLVLALNIHKIALSSADNTAAKFLSEVGGSNPLSLANAGTDFTGTLGVANGGTGITSASAGAIMHFSGSSTIAALTFRNKGDLMVGQADAAPIVLTKGTDGLFLKANNSTSSGLEWAAATFAGGTMTGDIDMANNDIDMGTGFINGSGTASRGLRFDSSSDNAYIGIGTFYNTGRLNVDGNIRLGANTGGTDTSILMMATTSGASADLTIGGSDATGTGNIAGNTTVRAGNGTDTNSNGGHLYLDGGTKNGSGTDGDIYLRTGGTSALVIDENQDVNVKAGSLVIDTATEGIVHKGLATVSQSTDHTTGVTINSTSGVITLAGVALNAAAEAEFTVTNSTVTSNSLILLTVVCPVASSATDNATMVAQISQLTSGAFKIRLSNPGAGNTSTNAHKVNFLVINNSV